ILYTGFSGDLPDKAEVAFKPAGQRPEEQDWVEAEIVADDSHPLWKEATSTPLKNVDYYVAILIGSYGDPGIPPWRTALASGDYQMWVRLTAPIERPVRIAPEAVEVT